MNPKYQLIIAGKNIVLNAQGFLDALSYENVIEEQSLSLSEGMREINKITGDAAVLATVHHGQPIILDGQDNELKEPLEKTLRQFTSSSGTDALSVFLTEDDQFSTYHYFRDGKLLRSVSKQGGEPDKEGIAIPYEATGTDPGLVLTAFCDSWPVLRQLSWTVFRLAPKLAHEQE